jgi:hypothetical protein
LYFDGGSQLPQQILWNKFHIRCAYSTPNCTWSLNYSVLVSDTFSGNTMRVHLTTAPGVLVIWVITHPSTFRDQHCLIKYINWQDTFQQLG